MVCSILTKSLIWGKNQSPVCFHLFIGRRSCVVSIYFLQFPHRFIFSLINSPASIQIRNNKIIPLLHYTTPLTYLFTNGVRPGQQATPCMDAAKVAS